jgi:hypothetical protein
MFSYVESFGASALESCAVNHRAGGKTVPINPIRTGAERNHVFSRDLLRAVEGKVLIAAAGPRRAADFYSDFASGNDGGL